MEPLRVQRDLEIPGDELRVAFSLAGGPGGQNVNKTATRVTLRFSVAKARSLDERTRARLIERLGVRLTRSGDLVVHAACHREQRRNLVDARARLAATLGRGPGSRPAPARAHAAHALLGAAAARGEEAAFGVQTPAATAVRRGGLTTRGEPSPCSGGARQPSVRR